MPSARDGNLTMHPASTAAAARGATRQTSQYHAPVHGKKLEPQPIASKPAIKKSRRDSAAKPRSGRVAAESQASSEQPFSHGSYPKRNRERVAAS